MKNKKNTSVLDVLLSKALQEKIEGKYFWSNKAFPILLKDPCREVRFAAANELRSRKLSNSVFVTICDLSLERDSDIREACAHALGEIGASNRQHSAKAADVLMVLMQDRSFDVRARAALSARDVTQNIGPTKRRKILKMIIEAAHDQHVEVRRCVAASLSGFQLSKNTLIALDKLMADRNRQVREWAALSAILILGKALNLSSSQYDALEGQISASKKYTFRKLREMANRLQVE